MSAFWERFWARDWLEQADIETCDDDDPPARYTGDSKHDATYHDGGKE